MKLFQAAAAMLAAGSILGCATPPPKQGQPLQLRKQPPKPYVFKMKLKTGEQIECSLMSPAYPAAAIRANVQGEVLAEFKIENGKTTDVKLLSGPEEFHDSVRQALMTSSCTPGISIVAKRIFEFRIADAIKEPKISN